MRIRVYSTALGAVLILGISCGAWAQDQPAAGSPPPGATPQQAAPDQSAGQGAAPAQAQAAPEQSAGQGTASAQDDELPPAPIDAQRGPNPHRQAMMLAKKLGLTQGQQADVELILTNRRQRMQHARNDATLAPQDRKAVVREINRDSVRRINAMLRPEQRQAYRQLRQEQRARRMEQREQQQPAAQPPAGNLE